MQHLLMAKMDTVEVANREDGMLGRLQKAGQGMKSLHLPRSI